MSELLSPEENNMGNMDASQAEQFFSEVRNSLELGNFGFGITTGGSICLGDKILIDERDLGYPWHTKQMILHEVTHHLVPKDTTHGTRFHSKYAELVSRFLGGEAQLDKLKDRPDRLDDEELREKVLKIDNILRNIRDAGWIAHEKNESVPEVYDTRKEIIALFDEARIRLEIITHLELLLKHNPARTIGLRSELGKYIKNLKEGKDYWKS